MKNRQFLFSMTLTGALAFCGALQVNLVAIETQQSPPRGDEAARFEMSPEETRSQMEDYKRFMTPEEIKMFQDVESSGRVVEIRPDGTKLIEKDGAFIQIPPDTKVFLDAEGSQIQIDRHGNRLIKKRDGTSIRMEDGWQDITNADGTKTYIKPNGQKIVEQKDGSQVITDPNGAKRIRKPDGTYVEITPGQ